MGDSQPLPVAPRRTVYFGGIAATLLFADLAANVFTGVWPQPWLTIELIVLFGCLLIVVMALAAILGTHPAAPRGQGREWIWAKCSPRFILLCVSLCFGPLGVVLFLGVWNQSHGWALLWGGSGVISAFVAYFAGRPWPRYE